MPPKRFRENNPLAAFSLTMNNILGTAPSAKKTKRASPNSRANALAASLKRANTVKVSPAKQKTPGVTKKTKRATSVKVQAGADSLNAFLRSKITSGTYREKVVWSFLIKVINEQNKPDIEKMFSSVANTPKKEQFIRMAREISAKTVDINEHNEVVFNFDDEQVFVHYFILWADGHHDKYIHDSFRNFLTNTGSYIRQLHMISDSAVKTILNQLETGKLPKIIQNIILSGGLRYKTEIKDIELTSTFEKNIKVGIPNIFGLQQPVEIQKGQHPNIGKRIEMCIDQEGDIQNLSKMLIGGQKQFSMALTPEQSVDPGSLMVMTGYASVAAMLLRSEKFMARLYAAMPKMVYKHNGKLLYSTKLRPVVPQSTSLVKAQVFEYYLETSGHQGVQIPYGRTAKQAQEAAKNGEIRVIIGKALGDNEQIAPIIFSHKHQSSQVKTFFATGDGMCAFQFVFLFNTKFKGEQPPLFLDTSVALGSTKSVWAYGLGSNYKILNSKVAHVKARSPEIATRRSIFGRSKKSTAQANKFRVAATAFTPAQKAALANISNRSKPTYNRALASKKVARLAHGENMNAVKTFLNSWKVKPVVSAKKQEYLTVMRSVKNKALRTAIRNAYYKKNKYVSNSNSNSPS